MIIKECKTALLLLLVLTVVTGIFYPLIVTGLTQWWFPWQTQGSLLIANNKIIGSALIGQSFTDEKYFWGRPSATSPFPYNAAASSGSNVGPSNPELLENVKKRVDDFQKTNTSEKIPIDLITASASGLDPDISEAAALYQIPRIANARHIPEEKIKALVDSIVLRPVIAGESRVNVLQLNLLLDEMP